MSCDLHKGVTVVDNWLFTGDVDTVCENCHEILSLSGGCVSERRMTVRDG